VSRGVTWESRGSHVVSRGSHVESRGCHVESRGVAWYHVGVTSHVESHVESRGVTWCHVESRGVVSCGGVTWCHHLLIILSSSLIVQVTLKHFLKMSQTSEITWFCPSCTKELQRKKKCPDCKVLTCYSCTVSGTTGLYNNFGRHKQRCSACNPKLEEKKFIRKRKLEQSLRGNVHKSIQLLTDFLQDKNLIRSGGGAIIIDLNLE
jgi:hypothetical protein